MISLLVGLLFVVGYPTAIVLLARFRRIVRTRAVGQFLVHQAAMAAVVVGWLLLDQPLGAALNAGWLVAAAGWWLWPRR